MGAERFHARTKRIESGCVLRCDVRTCVNPDHLYLGTKRDNARDMVSRGRWSNGRQHGPNAPAPRGRPVTSPAQARALARHRQEQEQLALERQPPRVLLDGPCPVCDDHDGWWLDDENPPVWEPCWAHEPLPDDRRRPAAEPAR